MAQDRFRETQWVFGRLNQYRGNPKNVVLHTLGKITLAGDGRILQAPEGAGNLWTWSDNSLNFSYLGGILATIFNGRMNIGGCDLMVGRSLTGPHLNYIFPYDPIKACRGKILYAVASHMRYGQFRQAILDSLLKSGVTREQIWVTIAASPLDEVRRVDGMTLSHVRENAYEYTALLDVVRRNPSYDWLFLIHDTCLLGPRFADSVESQPGNIGIEYMPVMGEALFNIGLYRKEFLHRLGSYWAGLDGITKKHAIDIELDREGLGLRNLAGVSSNFLYEFGQKLGVQTPYGPGLPRQGMYLPGADLYKYYHLDTPGPAGS